MTDNVIEFPDDWAAYLRRQGFVCAACEGNGCSYCEREAIERGWRPKPGPTDCPKCGARGGLIPLDEHEVTCYRCDYRDPRFFEHDDGPAAA
jgi:hypothetical protein